MRMHALLRAIHAAAHEEFRNVIRSRLPWRGLDPLPFNLLDQSYPTQYSLCCQQGR
jgi:hypothetical protein